jgi:hypothetical protein
MWMAAGFRFKEQDNEIGFSVRRIPLVASPGTSSSHDTLFPMIQPTGNLFDLPGNTRKPRMERWRMHLLQKRTLPRRARLDPIHGDTTMLYRCITRSFRD